MQLEHSFTVPVGIDDAWQTLVDIERIASCLPGVALDGRDGDGVTGTVKIRFGTTQVTYKGGARVVEKDEAGRRAVIEARGREARGSGTAAATVTAVLTDDGGDATTVRLTADLGGSGRVAQVDAGVRADLGDRMIGHFAERLAAQLVGGATRRPARRTAAAKTAPAAKTAAAEKAVPAEKAASVTKTAPAKPTTAAKTTAAKTTAAKTTAAKTTAAKTTAPKTAAATKTAGSATVRRVDEPPVAATAQAAQTPAAAVSPPSRPSRPASDTEPIDLIDSARPAAAKRLAPLLAALSLVVLIVLIVLRLRRR